MSSYEDAFANLCAVVVSELGTEPLLRGRVLRDAHGQLSFITATPLTSEVKERMATGLRQALGIFARPDRIIGDPSDVGVVPLLNEPASQWLPSQWGTVPTLDRRIVGADWLTPVESNNAVVPPRFAFASLKGGVGRTTALCVGAVELARNGKSILVIDLDLEAPGAASLLLPSDSQPRYGVLDFLVETSLGQDFATAAADIVAPSPFAASDGHIDVVPVIGATGHPSHFLGKLARALLDVGPDGATWPLRAKVAAMVEALTARARYDAVLVDVRAGLAEVSAGPLLGLDATLLLFGTAQRQTLDGLKLLFAHLSTLVPPGEPSPWRNMQFVLAKAPSREQDWFRDELYELFQSYLYEVQVDLEGFNFARDDQEAPHYPIPIAFHPDFADWDPSRRVGDLSHAFYIQAFEPFLAWIGRMVEPAP